MLYILVKTKTVFFNFRIFSQIPCIQLIRQLTKQLKYCDFKKCGHWFHNSKLWRHILIFDFYGYRAIQKSDSARIPKKAFKCYIYQPLNWSF